MNRIKLLITGAIASVGALVLPLIARGQDPGGIIELPPNFVTDALAYVGDLFWDLKLLLLVVIGLPLGFWVIRKIVHLVRAR